MSPSAAFEYKVKHLESCVERILNDSSFLVAANMSDINSSMNDIDKAIRGIPEPVMEENRRKKYNTDRGSVVKEAPETCEELFQKHQQHYNRSNDHTYSRGRFHLFLKSLIFVHFHNIRASSKHIHHIVHLNQFSDLRESELPIMMYFNPNDQIFQGVNEERNSYADIFQIENIQDIKNALRNIVRSTFTRSRHHHRHKKKRTPRHKLHPLSKNHTILERKFVNLQRPNSLKRKKSQTQHIDEDDWQVHAESREVGDFVKDEDEYSHYLNWATEQNPDGVSLVHPASEQGSCGSCWAFAATGSLEANVSRRTAFAKYKSTLSNLQNMTRNKAILAAQEIEKNVIRKTTLSVQELIDCDTQHDQGCYGGNPLLAYPFIRKYGLVSSAEYPYTGSDSKCHKKRVSDPIVTSDSWGILASKDELNMKLVLRYIGPIAVGINGSEKSFLAYKKGIFDSEKCKTHPNHALLIVGYGEEKRNDNHVVKYWIARNSWGTNWGENGYVKIRRKDDKKKKYAGVCGIATIPSVALGGRLLDSSLKKLDRAHLIQNSTRIQNILIEQKKSNHTSQSIVTIGSGLFGIIGLWILFSILVLHKRKENLQDSEKGDQLLGVLSSTKNNNEYGSINS